MKTDTKIRTEGLRVLTNSLGTLEAERFITLLLREPFDYTEWRQHLWQGKDAVTISREAMATRKMVRNSEASRCAETAANKDIKHDK